MERRNRNLSERRGFENYSSRRQARTPQVRNSSFRKSHSQSFLKSDLKNDNFSVIFQQFLNGDFAGFLERVIFLIRSMFLIFIVNPCVRIYESVKADNKKRLNLEGFEKIRKHRANYMLFLFICLLLLIGLVVMFSLSPQRANSLNIAKGANYDDYYFFWRHLIYIAVGLVFFFGMKAIPLNWIFSKSLQFFIFSLILCVALAGLALFKLPPVICENGACRWFGFSGFSFQQAEFLKIGVILLLSTFLGAQASKGKINSYKETILPASVVIIAVLLVIAGFQKDLGTATTIIIAIAFQFIIAGMKSKKLIPIGVLVLAGVVLLIVFEPHRISRILTFSSGDCSNILTESGKDQYHICNAKLAIGSGGVLGLGIGNSVQSAGYLPETINDSIFAVMGEMFGFVGLIFIIAIYFGLFYQLLVIISKMENPASRLFVAGVAGWLASQTIINIAAMVGLFPLKGITIPLISYGGTSLVVILTVLGVVFNISNYTSFTQVEDFKEEGNENIGSRRRVRRSRSSNRGGF